MPCVTDLTHVSTNSLPSTLLKKTNGKNQVPFHHRTVPSSLTKLQQRNDTDDDDDDVEMFSVSTQSTPLSRSQPSRTHSNKKGSTTATASTRDVSLDGSRNRPIVAPCELPYCTSNHDNNNNSSSHRPRRPSPERTISYQNTTMPVPTTKSRPSANPVASTPRSMKNKDASHVGKGDFDDFLSSTSNSSAPVDFTETVLQHPSMKSLSSSARESKKSNVNTTKQSNHNKILHQTATDMSEVLGRTIPFTGSSVNVLCPNDEEDDDDRHRYIVSITTSRSTIKASGGRNRYPKMGDYAAATSPLKPMKSYSFSNYSTQMEEEEEEEEIDDDTQWNDKVETTNQNESKDILHESNHTYDHNVSKYESVASLNLQKQRQNDINSTATSRHSVKLSTATNSSEPSRDNASGGVPTESQGRNENNSNSAKMMTMSVGHYDHHRQSTESASRTPSHNSPFTARVPAEHSKCYTNKPLRQSDCEKDNVSEGIPKEEASQSKTLSSTRFIRNSSHNDDDDDIVEAQRENEILSAAASRKSGKTGQTGMRTHTSSSNRSREVLIEDHEKPTKNEAVQSTTAWRKIDDVLFGDDNSELHLFQKPTKDVAFDDLLTTTSDCSSISVSLDPSGCIVHESNIKSSNRLDQVRNVITDVEFNRVKSVLDRVKKPMAVHTSTNNVGNFMSRGGAMAALNVPKMKNRIGTGNFVQNRFKNTPQVAIVRAAKQLEDSRKKSFVRPKSNEARVVHEDYIPIVVQARSFHGDATDQNIIESVPVVEPSLPNQAVVKIVDHRSLPMQSSAANGLSGRKDPPANTLCSEKR
jgi:hypothetical protein